MAIASYYLSSFQFLVGVTAFFGYRWLYWPIIQLCAIFSFLYLIIDTVRLCMWIPKILDFTERSVIMWASIVHHIASILCGVAMLNVAPEDVYYAYLMATRAMIVQLVTPFDKHNFGRKTWVRVTRILISAYVHIYSILGACLIILFAAKESNQDDPAVKIWWALALYCAWEIIIPYQVIWANYLIHSKRWSFTYKFIPRRET